MYDPSGENEGIESVPAFVSSCAPEDVWIQMLPALAYAIEPWKVSAGGTITTLGGAGVRPGPSPVVPSVPGPVLFTIGSCPLTRPIDTSAITTSATAATAGQMCSAIGPIPYGSRVPRRGRRAGPVVMTRSRRLPRPEP